MAFYFQLALHHAWHTFVSVRVNQWIKPLSLTFRYKVSFQVGAWKEELDGPLLLPVTSDAIRGNTECACFTDRNSRLKKQ
jgi:hypothetical protein